MATLNQLACARRRQSDAVLVGLDLFDNSDLHEARNPSLSQETGETSRRAEMSRIRDRRVTHACDFPGYDRSGEEVGGHRGRRGEADAAVEAH
jgi:hypothetical protein